MVVILVPSILNPFFTQFISESMHELKDAGYVPLVYETDNGSEAEIDFLAGPIARLADGIISVTDCIENEALIEVVEPFRSLNKPIIFVDRNLPANIADSIMSDNFEGFAFVVRHLYELGHRKIALILSSQGVSVVRDKVDGYLHALGELKLPFREEYLRRSGKWTRENGAQQAARLLDSADPPTAIIAGNNTLYARRCGGADSPQPASGQTISLVGTEECERDTLDFEKLGGSTLRLDSTALAKAACKSMLLKLAENEPQAEDNHTKTVFKMKYTERASVTRI
jgi:DNA-binding LacI/PurR family transcriptional regulator